MMKELYFKSFFNNSPTAYSCHRALFDQQGNPYDYEFLALNKAYEEMMELQDANVLNKRFYEVFPTGWQGEMEWKSTFNKAIMSRIPTHFDIHHYAIQKWIRVTVFPLFEDTFGCVYYDVTKEYMQNIEIEGFLKVNIDMLCVADTDGHFLRVNKAFEKVLGYKVEELEGKSFTSLIHLQDVPATLETMKHLEEQKSISSFVNRVRGKDGLYRYLEWHSQPNGKYIYASARDVTETQKLEMRLHQNNESLKKLTEKLEEKNKILKALAITDELTGLYNRHFLEQRIEDEMCSSDSNHQPLSMVIIDMDHFKHVNDTWGHPIGDEVLKDTAELTNSVIHQSDFLIRLGGEEFVIILPCSDLKVASLVAEKVRKAIGNYNYPVAGHLTASFGVAERSRFEPFYNWYKRVDKALYCAKEGGRNRVVSNEQEGLLNTPKPIEWNNEWLSGNKEIDQEHKELIMEANRLIYLSLSDADMDEKTHQLDIVLNHIKSHFNEEEQIIQAKGYPNYQRHTEIHRNLLTKAFRLKKAYQNEEIQPSVIFSFIVNEIIVNHTLVADKQFFDYTQKN